MPASTRPMLAIALAGLLSLAQTAPTRAQATLPPGAVKAQEAATQFLKNNVQGALALYTEALADPTLPNDRRAAIHSDRGLVYGRLGHRKLAIDDFNRAVQLFPEFPAAYNNRGTTLLQLGFAREAIKDFDRALLLAPGYAAAYSNRAGALMRAGQIDDALRDYNRAIELAPQNAAALSGRGLTHLAANRPYAAMRDFGRAVQIDVRLAAGHRALGEAKLTVGRHEEAVQDLSRALAFEPASLEIVLLRAGAYLQAKNLGSAIKDYARAIEINPSAVTAYTGRALAHARAEAFEEAEADLAKALELNPRSATAFAYRAVVHRLLEQTDLGLKELEKARRIEPGNADVLWAAGELEDAQGRTEEAIASYRKALAARPGFRDAREALVRLGADPDSGDTDVPGSGVDSWRVVVQGAHYFAVSDELPKVRVPLEMLGAGQPRLLEWERRKAPFRGIATLRFSAGTLSSPTGGDEVEQIAVIDTQAQTIAALHIHRQGERTARWTWDDGRITIAGIDGTSEEIAFKGARGLAGGQSPEGMAAVPRRPIAEAPSKPASSGGVPSWAPWAEQRSTGGDSRSAPRQAASKPKPKTLFDLLLGN